MLQSYATLWLFAAHAALLTGTWAAPAPATMTVTTPIVYCDLAIFGPPVTAITPSTPVLGLELGMDNGRAILTDGGFHTQISYANGGIGFFSGCHELWLNLGRNAHFYKPLTLDLDVEKTENWAVSSDGVIHATATSQYGQTSTFLACKETDEWVLYLKTGNGHDQPYGKTCTETKLQVGQSVGFPVVPVAPISVDLVSASATSSAT